LDAASADTDPRVPNIVGRRGAESFVARSVAATSSSLAEGQTSILRPGLEEVWAVVGFHFLTGGPMPQYVIERTSAGNLTQQQLRDIAQKSNSLLKDLGP
jgi:hypothetical protein